jgi:hypothetical protein
MANKNTTRSNTTNDPHDRIKHNTGQNYEHMPPRKHVIGDPDEIATRVGGTFPTLPEREATAFRQIGPSSQRGNMNNARPKSYKGNQKFGNPRRYA